MQKIFVYMVLYIIDVAAIILILERMVGAGGENNKIIDNNAPPQQPLGLQPHDGMYLHDHFVVTRSFHEQTLFSP